MITVADTSPLRYLILVGAVDVVTEDVIRESEQRYRQRKLVQEQQSSQAEEK